MRHTVIHTEIDCGTFLDGAVREMRALAEKTELPVKALFNGTVLEVRPTDTEVEAVERWRKEREAGYGSKV